MRTPDSGDGVAELRHFYICHHNYFIQCVFLMDLQGRKRMTFYLSTGRLTK